MDINLRIELALLQRAIEREAAKSVQRGVPLWPAMESARRIVREQRNNERVNGVKQQN